MFLQGVNTKKAMRPWSLHSHTYAPSLSGAAKGWEDGQARLRIMGWKVGWREKGGPGKFFLIRCLKEVKPAAQTSEELKHQPVSQESWFWEVLGSGQKLGAQHHPRRKTLSFPKFLFSVDIQPK